MDNLSGQPLGWVIFSVIGTFINKFAFIAVPLFFAISGYLEIILLSYSLEDTTDLNGLAVGACHTV